MALSSLWVHWVNVGYTCLPPMLLDTCAVFKQTTSQKKKQPKSWASEACAWLKPEAAQCLAQEQLQGSQGLALTPAGTHPRPARNMASGAKGQGAGYTQAWHQLSACKQANSRERSLLQGPCKGKDRAWELERLG